MSQLDIRREVEQEHCISVESLDSTFLGLVEQLGGFKITGEKMSQGDHCA